MRLVYFLDIARMAVNVGIVGYRRFHILEHFLILCFRFSGDSQRKYVVPGQKRLDRVTFQDAGQGIHVIQIFEVKGVCKGISVVVVAFHGYDPAEALSVHPSSSCFRRCLARVSSV